MPVFASNRAPTAFGSSAPPVTAIRTPDAVSPSRQEPVIAAIDVGTPLTTVAR
mgnify:CR=1 FL=1